MNPTLPADYLDRMREGDPEAYRSEVLGGFRTGLSTLLDPDALESCVVNRLELPPVDGLWYVAFVDPSGGSRDAFTCGIGHADGGRVVIDVVRAWPAPFNPTGVVAEVAALLQSYRTSTVVGDRYAGESPREAFRSCGIEYEVSELDRSRLYLELLPLVNAGTWRSWTTRSCSASCAGSNAGAARPAAIVWTIVPAVTTTERTRSPAARGAFKERGKGTTT
jgi:hypothetical protein